MSGAGGCGVPGPRATRAPSPVSSTPWGGSGRSLVAAEAPAERSLVRRPGSGDVLLEVNGAPVSGLTDQDTLAVIRHFREPIRLRTVKPGVLWAWGLGSPSSRLPGDGEEAAPIFPIVRIVKLSSG